MSTKNNKTEAIFEENDESKKAILMETITKDDQQQHDNRTPDTACANSIENEEINMERIYTDDIDSVKYFLKKASHLSLNYTKDRPPYQQLKALLLKLKRAVPFLQFIYSNTLVEDLKLLQKVGHKYMLDKNTTEKERIRISEAVENLTTLVQHTLVNRIFIKYLLWQYKWKLKNLAKMLHVNIGRMDEAEIEEFETVEEDKNI